MPEIVQRVLELSIGAVTLPLARSSANTVFLLSFAGQNTKSPVSVRRICPAAEALAWRIHRVDA